jgi:hypothetical protein
MIMTQREAVSVKLKAQRVRSLKPQAANGERMDSGEEVRAGSLRLSASSKPLLSSIE